jgi:hypothetical protein
MPPSRFEPHTGRYLSFAEREEIALPRLRGYGGERGAAEAGRERLIPRVHAGTASPG